MNSNVERNEGTTPSERYLAQLAERTFLNLWTYPNLFIDRKASKNGDGKELCDLLVVCGDDVFIFSDKTIEFKETTDPLVGWKRWYRQAVTKSCDQIFGAERWLEQFPDRLYLDRKCTKKWPLSLPPKDRRRVHRIVVALGAGEACKKFYHTDRGSLLVRPRIGHAALEETPFSIGDVDPNRPFVHVFDDGTLDIVMRELDTVSDLARYLSSKEKFVRSEYFGGAGGEEDLVAYYLQHLNSEGDHDFVKPDRTKWNTGDVLFIETGSYAGFVSSKHYKAKKQAEEASYIWDTLIETFTSNMLAGTTIVHENREFLLSEYEEPVRRMVLQPRHHRRNLGGAILDALERYQDKDRIFRALIPTPGQDDTGFFVLALRPGKFLDKGYEEYREIRRHMTYGYALSLLRKNPTLKRIIGIAFEPPPKPGEKPGGSEDIMQVETPEWTEERLKELASYEDGLDLMKGDRVRKYRVHSDEYPKASAKKAKTFIRPIELNRHQRRAAKARARKRR